MRYASGGSTRRDVLKQIGAASVIGFGGVGVAGTASAASADFDYPVNGTVSQPYHGGHNAVDIANSIGTPIYASHAGTASTHYQAGGCGYYVKVQHGGGYYTLYCHMSDFDVSGGQSVSRGQQIGNVGTSGNTTGPHVHFEINRYGDEVYVPATDGEYVNAGEGIPKDYPGIGGGGGGNYNWPVFSRGDQSTDIYSVQYLLEQHGHNLQYHDGIYGPETESEVTAFQRGANIAVDGIVGPQTWGELIVNVFGPSQDPYWATYAVQHNLRYDHGHSIAVDGLYGPETEGAIEGFQSASNITVDGLVGPETWQALVDQ